MGLILPSRTIRQPFQALPIARSNPILAGLAHAWMVNSGGQRAVIDVIGSAHGVFGAGTGGTSGNAWKSGLQGYYLNFDDTGTGSVDSPVLPVGGTTDANCGGPSGNIFSIHAKVRFGSQPGWDQCILGSASNGVSLRVNSSGKLQLLKSGVALMAASTASVSMGVDVNLAATYDGTNAKLYINGVLDSTTAASQTFSKVQFALGTRGLIAAGSITTNERMSNGSRIYHCVVWNRVCAHSELRAFESNPWQMFQGASRKLWLSAAASNITLVGANSSQANTSSTAAAAQRHTLAGSTGSQANTSSTGAIGQTRKIAGTNASQASTSTSGAITQRHKLTGTTASQANTTATAAAGQRHVLAGSTSSQANASTTGALGQRRILVGAASSQTNASASGAVTQRHQIAGAGTAQTNTTTVAAAAQRHVLGGSTSSQANLCTTGSLTASQKLTAAATTQASTSGTGAIVQRHKLGGASTIQIASSGAGIIVQKHKIAGATTTQTSTTTTAALGQVRHILAGSTSSQANAATSGAMGQRHALTGSASTSAATSQAGAVTQHHKLTGATSVLNSTSGAGAIIIRPPIVLAGSTSSQANAATVGAIVQRTPGQTSLTPADIQAIADAVWAHSRAQFVLTTAGFLALK